MQVPRVSCASAYPRPVRLHSLQTHLSPPGLRPAALPDMAAAGHWHALALTCLGAGGTALGGALVCIQPKMDFQQLGLLQVGGGACTLPCLCKDGTLFELHPAGMDFLSISIIELLPGAASPLPPTHTHKCTHPHTNTYRASPAGSC